METANTVKDVISSQMREVEEWLADVSDLHISCASDLDHVAKALGKVKARAAAFEAQRKAIVGPINDSVKQINDLFRRPLAALATIEAAIKNAILVFQRDQARIEEQRLLEASKAAQAGRKEDARALIVKATEAAPVKLQGISTQNVYQFRITDAALVPREFLMVNEKAIGELVRAKHGEVVIPGVEVIVTQTIRAGKGS